MPAKLLTRAQAAKALGMSVATLRRREGKQIHPVMSSLGEHLFRAMDVLRLRNAVLAGKIPGLVSNSAPATPAQVRARLRKQTEERERAELLEANRLRISVATLRRRRLRDLAIAGPVLRGARSMTQAKLDAIRAGIAAGKRNADIVRETGAGRSTVSVVRLGERWNAR